jgi:hypothetical protein
MEVLDAVEKRDNDALKKALSKQVFTFLDNDVYTFFTFLLTLEGWKACQEIDGIRSTYQGKRRGR